MQCHWLSFWCHVFNLFTLHPAFWIILGRRDYLKPPEEDISGRTFRYILQMVIITAIAIVRRNHCDRILTRSSVARARLSLGDRFTPEKPLLDGPHSNYAASTTALPKYTMMLLHHYNTTAPYPCTTIQLSNTVFLHSNFQLHTEDLVEAFHRWLIHPSLIPWMPSRCFWQENSDDCHHL